MKFLLVDDEEMVLAELVYAVRAVRPDAEISAFQSGKEAWEAAQQTKYDVLITDIAPLEMKGAELANLIHEKYPDTQILFQTAELEMILLRSGYPVERCIYKPVNEKAMKEKLDMLDSLPPFAMASSEDKIPKGLIAKLKYFFRKIKKLLS